MDKIILKYGGQRLTLNKSSDLIAIKPKQNKLHELSRSAKRFDIAVEKGVLGRFNILNVSESASSHEDGLDSLRADSVVELGSHVYHTSDDQVPFVPTGQVYAQIKSGASKAKVNRLIQKLGLEILTVDQDDSITFKITAVSPNPVKVAKIMQDSDLVDFAEPDLATPGELFSSVYPQDELINSQWHLNNTGNHRGTSYGLKRGADARVLKAWDELGSLGDPAIMVGVIDDGFDLSHPDLGGNGKVVAPWDFTRGSKDVSPEYSSSYPYYSHKYRSWQGDWHGAACAGVAVGSANGIGIVGAAPNSKLIPVRWGTDLNDGQVTSWFDHVQKNGAAVVSCSWGAEARNYVLSTKQKRAIASCATYGRNGLGCVVVFAAGNENRNINDPATGSVGGFAIHPDVIAVAACNSQDKKSHYSNYGAEISICAPSSGAGGMGIATSDVTGTFEHGGQTIEAGYSPGDYTYDFGGTSSACPLVAGIAALVLSANPSLTAKEVKQVLESSARKIGPSGGYDANGHSQMFGYGCVNALEAVKTANNI